MSNPLEGADAPQPGPLTQYANYSVFRRLPGTTAPGAIGAAIAELEAVLPQIEAKGISLRGFYDLNGFRQDGDVLVWLHGEDPEALQSAVRRIRSTVLFANLELTWQVTGVHRAAEFNERHMPAYMLGREAKKWITIYPFVRSYDWYLLPDEERSVMLRDHGIRGAAFKSVLANTIAAFGISDYEWMLSFEDDELLNILDMMRDLRYTEARRHVREETPFYTGRRIPASQVPVALRFTEETA
ncbi:hydrogen peroxide-dependent heme synthase [Gulosibacter sp. 10]|uniref:hydrogen peroxide-dependent heme synthase n=1 Tax=Gulosibacter sp. 10 TaxID=1255570 RepID=UPI00097E7DDD|nr:hydrogen peroxide-dependent heme synthase [Gulosibacter sp. 10]SJM68137.1 Hemoprotein HemQ, essential component of heme biosynthetic pathway in Gram-positive bacteria [Gulosibacter sp. 10]